MRHRLLRLLLLLLLMVVMTMMMMWLVSIVAARTSAAVAVWVAAVRRTVLLVYQVLDECHHRLRLVRHRLQRTRSSQRYIATLVTVTIVQTPVSKLMSVLSREISQYLLKSGGWSTSGSLVEEGEGGMLEPLQGNISTICLRVKPQKLDDFKVTWSGRKCVKMRPFCLRVRSLNYYCQL